MEFSSELRRKLRRVFKEYPSTSGYCDRCASRVANALKTEGFDVDIQRMKNKAIPGIEITWILAKDAEGTPFNIGDFHEFVRIKLPESEILYLDALVYEHFGVNPVHEETYFGLFIYADELELFPPRQPE